MVSAPAVLLLSFVIVQASSDELTILSGFTGFSMQLSTIEDNILGKLSTLNRDLAATSDKLSSTLNNVKSALTGVSTQLLKVEDNVLAKLSSIEKSVSDVGDNYY